MTVATPIPVKTAAVNIIAPAESAPDENPLNNCTFLFHIRATNEKSLIGSNLPKAHFSRISLSKLQKKFCL